MKNRYPVCLMTLVLVICTLFFGCGKAFEEDKKKKPSGEAIDITIQDEECYAMITKSSGNAYNDHIADAFCETIDKAGKQSFVYQPDKGTAKEQIEAVKQLIEQKARCIAIAPVDADALDKVLQSAIDAGIPVISFDTPANPESRLLNVNQSGTEQIAKTLMDAVAEAAPNGGYWAIVSSFSTSSNQNAWISAMRELSDEEKYKKNRLVEIAFGDDDYHKSYDQTISLLKKYPDLGVICAPTTVGIKAATAAVKDAGAHVKVVGLGLPSEMAEYVKDGSVCPFIYMWNPNDLGRITAYVTMAFGARKIDGEEGEQFKVDMGKVYTVTKADDGGTEVITGSPYRYDKNNVEEWKSVY